MKTEAINVSREEKKVEAIERMKMLKMSPDCIKVFKENNEVQLSEGRGALYEFSRETELVSKIKEFEEQYNALVYTVIHNFFNFGECYSFLYVSDYKEEWERDREDVQNDINCPCVYVWNKDDDMCSEFGSITVVPIFGGLVRLG